MKSVLISIRPMWCELLEKGEKTIVGMGIEPPFKCYIYCAQGNKEDCCIISDAMYRKRNRVIGEFNCYSIEEISPTDQSVIFIGNEPKFWDQLGYIWHISDLVFYEKPFCEPHFKELGFREPPYTTDYYYLEKAGELKSCPFCGGKAVMNYEDMSTFPNYSVVCEECGARSAFCSIVEGADAAEELWNRRQNVSDSNVSDGAELKSCPFCGGEAIATDEENDYCLDLFTVACLMCGAKSEPLIDQEETIARWNTRKGGE